MSAQYFNRLKMMPCIKRASRSSQLALQNTGCSWVSIGSSCNDVVLQTLCFSCRLRACVRSRPSSLLIKTLTKSRIHEPCCSAFRKNNCSSSDLSRTALRSAALPTSAAYSSFSSSCLSLTTAWSGEKIPRATST